MPSITTWKTSFQLPAESQKFWSSSIKILALFDATGSPIAVLSRILRHIVPIQNQLLIEQAKRRREH